MKKKVVLPVIGVFLLVVSIAGISYAYWKYSSTQELSNVIGTDCLDLQLIDETEAITLEEAYPLSNEEGKKLKPYQFTVKNTCNTLIDYSVNLDSLASENYMNNKYIAVSIDEEAIKVLSEFKEAEVFNQEGKTQVIESHTLVKGFLDKKESKTHTLRLWIDEDADNGAMEKTFASKVVIVGTPNEVYATAPNVRVTNLNANKEILNDFEVTNHYAYSSEADILCEGEKTSCFVKFNQEVLLKGEILQYCGTESLPGECRDITAEEVIQPNNWYRTKKNVHLKPTETQATPIQIETLVCVGNDCSEKENYTLQKQDKIAPTITINQINANTTGAVIQMDIQEQESGIKNVSCNYGLTEDNLNIVGTLTDNTCTLTGFVSNKTYYYEIVATDKVENLTKKTGTITTDEIITAPTLTGGSPEYASSRTIRVATPGTADTGVKIYEYYISKSNETPSSDVTPSGTTMDEITIDAEGTCYVFYRTISNEDNKSSWSGAEEVNIYYKASSITYTNSDDASIQNVQQAIDAIRTKWKGENS